jgi:hypothetical protein
MIHDGTTVKVSPNKGIERLKNVEKRDFTFEQRVRANPPVEVYRIPLNLWNPAEVGTTG